MLEADEFDPFLNDMFQNPEDNLLDEAETFLRTLQTKLDEQEGIYNEFKQKHLKWYDNFNVFQKEFGKYNEEITKNLKKIQENKDVMNPGIDISRLVAKIFKNKSQTIQFANRCCTYTGTGTKSANDKSHAHNGPTEECRPQERGIDIDQA